MCLNLLHSFLYVPSLPLFLKVDDASKTEPIVRFVPIMLFSRQVHLLLNENGGRLLFANFESSYLERFGVQCRPSAYGHSSIISLLQSILHLVVIRGKGPRRVLTLHREMAGKNLLLFKFYIVFEQIVTIKANRNISWAFFLVSSSL